MTWAPIALLGVGLWGWLIWHVFIAQDFFGDEGHPDEWRR